MTRILVVEDEAELAELVETILSSEGYEVKMARNGLEALASIDGKLPHLVLLDLMMPDIDGCTVFKSLKADSKTESVPVVLMSASDRLSAVAATLHPDGSLKKPFSIDALLTCVANHALDPERATRAPGKPALSPTW